MAMIKVGGAEIEVDQARALVTDYVSKNGEWAYPAYDAYAGSGTTELGDADFLAPVLLNVRHLGLESYYALQSLLPEMNDRLAQLRGKTLIDADEATLAALSELLTLHDSRDVPGVRLTTLSKVLHRKAPHLIPLYDRHIWRCYAEIGSAPIPLSRDRSWAEFTDKWLAAVKADLTRDLETWSALADLASEPTISPLRALDIVGWNLGRPSSGAVDANDEV